MSRPIPGSIILLAISFILSGVSHARAERCDAEDKEALARAHAHNDYEHERPLLDALEQGFTSLEADVWLVDGELLVAHDEVDLDPERTLEALYLAPLAQRAKEHDGHVYPDWPHSIHLLIDIKSEAEPTYKAVHLALAKYHRIFTKFVDGSAFESAVTATISGNRPREYMAAQRIRFAGYDGRASDLGDGGSAEFIPLISNNWTNLFAWMGDGSMPEDELAYLYEYVAEAHAHGQRVRFWATSDEPGVRESLWQVMVDAGVDYINTDDLPGLASWLLENDAAPSEPEVDWFDYGCLCPSDRN